MPSPQHHEEALFQAAVQLTGAERAAFLNGACLGDAALRQRLDALLAAHDQPDNFVPAPEDAARPTIKLDLADAPDEAVGQTLGRYKLLERVGEGGCGVVYVAEQTEPMRRRVALKVIKLGMDTKQVVARFEAERQALAMMDHPNIAKVLDAGTTDVGRPFFVMELVRGIKITDYCDQANCNTKERLDLFIKVCQAIQHAHQKGIIHRDIKPSNILVTLHEGVPVPKVIDFGIAKATEGRLTDNTVYTQLHQFIGTPAYMSPEQAEMSGLDIDTRSDIYSLGVLLYELLAGSTPFDAKELMASGIDAMRKTIREKEPVRPSTKLSQTLVAADVRRLKSTSANTPQSEEEVRASSRRLLQVKEAIHALKGDLDWIVMKCLEKDRTRRYDTANGLAADLKRHLTNEPVVARPPSTAYTLQKAFRRNKIVFASGASIILALVVGLIAVAWQAVRATRAEREQSRLRAAAEMANEQEAASRRAAEAEKTRAEEARTKATEEWGRAEASERATRDLLYFANMGLAQKAWEEGDIERLERLLSETAGHPQRGFEWFYWMRQLHQETLTFREHRHRVGMVEFSPDGQWIASASMADNTIKVWGVRDGQVRHEWKEGEDPVNALAFSPDGRRLATLSLDSKLSLRDTQNGQLIREFSSGTTNRRTRRFAAWAPDGSRILTAGSDAVQLWNASTGEELRRIVRERRGLAIPRFSAEGRPQAAVEDEAGVCLLDVESGERILSFDATELVSGSFSRDNRRFAMRTRDQVIVVFNADTGQELRRWPGGDSTFWDMKLSDDGSVLAVSEGNGSIRLLEVGSGAELGTLKGHRLRVWNMDFSPDTQTLASASLDETVKIWDWRNILEPPSSLQSHPRLRVFLSGDGSTAIVVTNRSPEALWFVPGTDRRARVDVEARLVETRTGRTRAILPGLTVLDPPEFSPDGGRVVGVNTNFFLAHIWDAATGRVLLTFDGQTNRMSRPMFSPDGRQITIAEWGRGPNALRLWDAFTGARRSNLGTNQPSSVTPLAFSPDGRWLLTALPFSPVYTLWNTVTGQEELIVSETTLGGADGGAFSPDGKLIATLNTMEAAIRVQPAPAKESRSIGPAFTLNTRAAQHVAFSPDSRRILSQSDGTAKLWDAATGRDLLTLRIPRFAKCQFSPDGQSIITARSDGTLIRYEAATRAQIAVWEAADRPVVLRRQTQMARNSTSALLKSRRYTELEAMARETLKALRADPRPDPAGIVEFTLRLAASILSRASEGNAKGTTTSLTAEAEQLLSRISTEELSGYLQSDPGWNIAAFLCQAGHWTHADAFLARVTDLDPTNNYAWQLRAALAVKTRDLSAYDKSRAHLVKEFSATTNGWGFWEIRTITLRPSNPLDASIESAADRAIASESDPANRQELHLSKALFRYRLRNLTGALESLENAGPLAGRTRTHASFTPAFLAVRAMVLHELSKPAEARAALAEGAKILQANWFSPERGSLEEGGWWVNWLAADLLLTEAREQIEQAAKAAEKNGAQH